MKKLSKQIWIITITDLLLIIICFIVLIYSNILIKNSKQFFEEIDSIKYANTKNFKKDTNFLVSFFNMKNLLSNTENIYLSYDSKIIKYELNEKIDKDIENINHIIDKFSDNKKVISLILKSDFLNNYKSNNSNISESDLVNKIKLLDEIRNILAKNPNASNIASVIKNDDEYLSSIDKEFVFVIEIFAKKN